MHLCIKIERLPAGEPVRAISAFATYTDDYSDCGVFDARTSIDEIVSKVQHGWAGVNRCLAKLELRELPIDPR